MTAEMNIDELELVVLRGLAGQMRLDEASTIWNASVLSAEQDTLMHQLIHFITDDDLRSRDAQYNQMQRSQILGMLAALKTNKHSP